MDNWDDIKSKYEVETTEELFGITSPAEYQCDNIDKVKNSIGVIEIHSEIKKRDRDDIEHLLDQLSLIEYEVHGLEDDVERIRDEIVMVREWGTQWKDLCKKLVLEYNIDVSELR